jgi:hypothetical protein
MKRKYPNPNCPDCEGHGVVEVGYQEYSECPCTYEDFELCENQNK